VKLLPRLARKRPVRSCGGRRQRAGAGSPRQARHRLLRAWPRSADVLPVAITVFVIAGGLVVASVSLGCGARPAARPNVILISIDTLRADRLNTYGYRARATSPEMDALARDGIVFEKAITASPWTTPAHMSLLTSLTPSAHGIVASFGDLESQLERNVVQRLPEERVTLAEALAAHGYTTAAFTGGVTLDPRIGFDQGFSIYTTNMFKVGEPAFAGMLGWLREHRKAPFFLFWHTFEVHSPYLDTRFLGEVLPEPNASHVREDVEGFRRQLAAHGYSDFLVGKMALFLKTRGALNATVVDALYTGGIASADRWLGRLVRFLREEGLYDDTLIVVSSDHGEELGDHDPESFYNRHGHSLYEELVHVPLVVKLPGEKHAGTRVGPVVRTIDVFPTILDVLRLPPSTGVEGRSLRPTWEGGEPAGRVALVEATAYGPEKKAVREDRYKYIVTIDPQTLAARGRNFVPEFPASRELYDLRRDPAERRNLIAPGAPDPPVQLASRLDLALRAAVAKRIGATERAVIDDATVEKLKALGYVR
jgi:arylsulfatase A-like enzyme